MMITDPMWRTSTYSGQQNNCVQVAGDLEQIRDSKNPSGPTLRVNLPVLLSAVKRGEFIQR
jgi:hypothetical protein